MQVRYAGHATVRVDLDGVSLLTDPVLGSRVSLLRRHGPLPGPDLTRDLDAVLISHLHADHLDPVSLRAIDPSVPVIAPRGAGSVIARAGRREVIEIGIGDQITLGRVRVQATDAAHPGSRLPLIGARAEAVGYLVSAPSARLYFAGDTELFPGMADLARHEGRGLDLALLPVWGWGPTLGPGHLNPAQAAEAAAMLGPRASVPIHWGTLFPLGLGRWRRRLLVDPPHEFAERVRELALETAVEVLQPAGAPLVLDPAAPGEARASPASSA